MKKEKLFFNFTGVETDEQYTVEEFETAYKIVFKNTDEVDLFYDLMKQSSHKTNFGGNPREWASYSIFKQEGINYIVYAPKQSNGDNNWWSYPTNTKRHTFVIEQTIK